jgi:hypothetical protein
MGLGKWLLLRAIQFLVFLAAIGVFGIFGPLWMIVLASRSAAERSVSVRRTRALVRRIRLARRSGRLDPGRTVEDIVGWLGRPAFRRHETRYVYRSQNGGDEAFYVSVAEGRVTGIGRGILRPAESGGDVRRLVAAHVAANGEYLRSAIEKVFESGMAAIGDPFADVLAWRPRPDREDRVEYLCYPIRRKGVRTQWLVVRALGDRIERASIEDRSFPLPPPRS